jgi:hypothetical protein
VRRPPGVHAEGPHEFDAEVARRALLLDEVFQVLVEVLDSWPDFIVSAHVMQPVEWLLTAREQFDGGLLGPQPKHIDQIGRFRQLEVLIRGAIPEDAGRYGDLVYARRLHHLLPLRFWAVA